MAARVFDREPSEPRYLSIFAPVIVRAIVAC
jgi:hypothetical protein